MVAQSPPPIALTMGDPAGCGPQITAAAWAALRETISAPFAVIGPSHLYAQYCDVRIIDDFADLGGVFRDALPVYDRGWPLGQIEPGKPQIDSGQFVIESIEIAVDLATTKKVSAVVTNPINKNMLYKYGFKYPGHTEFIAALCAPAGAQPVRPIMMLVGGGLRVALATIHLPLAKAIDAIQTPMLIDTARIVADALKRDFGLSKPKIAFTGLNPHAGENGTLGKEEIEIINPAAKRLRAEGIDITDARSADTVFAEALQGDYDAVIAMTHDQGLIPVKTLDFWGGVNTTLGLPIIRTSPDHGTAYEAAENSTCRPDSLIAAIELASKNAASRAAHDCPS